MDYLDEALEIAAQRWADTEDQHKSERDRLKDSVIAAALRIQPHQDWEIASVCPVNGSEVYVVSIWKVYQRPEGGGSIFLKVVFVKWDPRQGYIAIDADRI